MTGRLLLFLASVSFLLRWSSQDPGILRDLLDGLEKRGARLVRDEGAPSRPVVELDLHRVNMTDRTLEQVCSIPTLRLLDLSHTQITDKGMAFLPRLKGLEELTLHNTGISDLGLKPVAKLANLRLLDLADT